MDFDDEFPHPLGLEWPDDLFGVDGDSVFRTGVPYLPAPCGMCQRLTHWVSISFEGHYCSCRCLSAMWEEFFAACRRTDLLGDPSPEVPF
jgi:hypothetical protein